MRNYKRARISFTFHFLQFLKLIQREDTIQKAKPSKKLGCFFSQLHATEAHKDIIRDYRRGSTTIIVKNSEWESTS